jgi:hypothetical protein
MFSFQINGSTDYFGTGKMPPPEVGTMVTFDESMKPNGFKEAKNIQIQNSQPVQSGVKIAASVTDIPVGVSRDDYWRIKDERDVAKQAVIELQSCRNSAIELVKLMITPTGDGTAGLKLPAQAKREEFLVALVTKYTYEFLAANHNKEENKNDEARDESAAEGATTDGEWNV